VTYLENLIENAKIALISKPVKEQIITNLDDINSLDITKGVYIIEEVGGNKFNTRLDFLEHKIKKAAALSRLNEPNDVLYVGSSRKDLRKRLLQHMGYGSESTYALHLNKWFKGQIKITIKQYDVSDDVLQLIEDSIAFDLQPAFGRRGAR